MIVWYVVCYDVKKKNHCCCIEFAAVYFISLAAARLFTSELDWHQLPCLTHINGWFKFITFQRDPCIYQIDAIIHSLRISFPFCILTCVIHLILFLMDNGFVSLRSLYIYIHNQVFRWKKSHYHLEYMFLKMDTCICIQNFC